MIKPTLVIITSILCSLIFSLHGFDQEEPFLKPLDKHVSQQGMVSFLLETDKAYKNGNGDKRFFQALFELPGLAGCYLQRTDLSVDIFFGWEGKKPLERSFHIEFQDLPGPESYFFQFSWDATKGLSDGYMNGIPLRCPGIRFDPWIIEGKATQLKIQPGPNKVTVSEIVPRYMRKKELIKQVPEELRGKNSHLLGLIDGPEPLDISRRRSKLLYASTMNESASVNEWILEGPGELTFEDESLIMRSLTPNPPTRGTGHIVLWCPDDFPESFIAEWEFKPLKEHGFCIVFFAAKGENGEDIFDQSLPKRDGRYPFYTTGAIMNYHISYFANLPKYQTGRLYSLLRKCNKFHNVAQGPIAVKPGAKGFHRIRLIKDGAHIQLLCNDKVSLDFTDPGGERYGSILGGGKIGLRQMAVTEGAYRNFKVWELYKP